MTAITMQPKPTKQRRRRGVILTSEGLERLQQAKIEAEYSENQGYRYTLEVLSERTELAVDTLTKVFACESGVDKQTLKSCFKAFKLKLEDEDYYRPTLPVTQPCVVPQQAEPELPEGQVPLDSNFYIERASIEADCYKTVLQPGSLIRLKAPRRMGKTSLMTRILDHAHVNGCHVVPISLQLADKRFLQDLDKFLQWFCANVSLGVKFPNRVPDCWDDLFGSKISCKIYLEKYILAQLDQPLVLGIDDIDLLFQYPDLADDFFGLLRAWHEDAKNREIWKKLRLIVVHSSEVYIPLNVNQSPFNVGFPIELPLLNSEQVQRLAKCHNLSWSLGQVTQLMDLVGGHPYLVRLALYHIWREDITIEKLLTTPPQSSSNIYSDHLQRQSWNIQQQHSNLWEALARVVLSPEPIELDPICAVKLQSLGLIRWQGNRVKLSCLLYQRYFYQYFQGS